MSPRDIQMYMFICGLLLLNSVAYLKPRLTAYIRSGSGSLSSSSSSGSSGSSSHGGGVSPRLARRSLQGQLAPAVFKYLENLEASKAGAYTLFAPSKRAWERAAKKLGDASSVADRLGDHVVPRRILAGDVPTRGLRVSAVSGAEIYVSAASGGLLAVNGVAATRVDVPVGEGIVHVMADVIPDGSAAAAAADADDATTSSGDDAHASSDQVTTDAPQKANAAAAAAARQKPQQQSRKRWHFVDNIRARRAAPPQASSNLLHMAVSNIHSTFGLRTRLEQSDLRVNVAMKAKVYFMNRPCHGRGIKGGSADSGEGIRGACVCAAMYEGQTCERAKVLRDVPQLGRGFDRDVTLSRVNIDFVPNLVVHTKEKTLTIVSKLSETVRTQMKEFLPDQCPLSTNFHHRCAIVGSSGVLMRHQNGKEIDSADFVVRFNSAPTRGYEGSVGTRTDLRLSNGEHIGYKERNETVIHHLKASSFLFKLFLYAAKFPPANGHAQPLAFHPEFTSYVAKVGRGTIPSSGLFAVMLALHTCAEVKLYGFHASFRHGSRHHYFNTETPSNERRDESEFNMLKAMSDAGMLSFAEPCIIECHMDQSECNRCIGEDMSLEELAMRERWSPVQRQMNEAHEKRWRDMIVWDKDMDKHFGFNEENGLFSKDALNGK